MPYSLQTNSHVNLANAGFDHYDIKELRFFCKEKYKNQSRFWHFKTNNEQMIQVALIGDQSFLKTNSISQNYVELEPDFRLGNEYRRVVPKNAIDDYVPIENQKSGGFTNTPFGSLKQKQFWTIGGANSNKLRFECASFHEYNNSMGEIDRDPLLVDTHHTIWFRGNAPTKDQAYKRFLYNKSIK